MAKICTTIEQSKKLIELGINVNSADMWYHNRVNIPDNYPLPIEWKHNNSLLSQEIPAWSLSALVDLMPIECKLEKTLFDQSDYFTYACEWTGEYRTYEYEDPLDAAFEMVVWLKENNKI